MLTLPLYKGPVCHSVFELFLCVSYILLHLAANLCGAAALSPGPPSAFFALRFSFFFAALLFADAAAADATAVAHKQ
jgi:hypothetical protein